MKIIWNANIEGGAGQPPIEEGSGQPPIKDPASLLLEEQEEGGDGEEEQPPSRWPGAYRF